MRRPSRHFQPSFDRLDVLVLAQGAVIYRRGEFEMEGFRKVLEVNLISLMACAVKFHPMLKAAKGSLIIVSSTAAYHATKGNPAYNASKTGAVGLTRTLAQAWAEDGIRVNGIAPGLVDTKMTKVTTANPKRLEGAIEKDSAETAGHARRHGRRRAVPGLAAGVLYRRPHAGGRWRADFVTAPYALIPRSRALARASRMDGHCSWFEPRAMSALPA